MSAAYLPAASFAGLAGWLVMRSIPRPIDQAVALADSVARGDLLARVDVAVNDEAAKLLASRSRASQNLTNIDSKVNLPASLRFGVPGCQASAPTAP